MRTWIGFVKALGVLAMLAWLSTIGLFLRYDVTRPTVRQVAEGRIYAWNNHGHIVYLTQQEQLRLYILGGISASLFAVAASMGYWAKWRMGRKESDS
jgi:hypothetical protein